MNTYLLSAAALALSAGSALAGGYQSPVVQQPIVTPPITMIETPPSDWTGAYAGGNLGYGRGSIDAKGILGLQADAIGIDRTLFEPDGLTGAVRGGYDWQRNNLVYGVAAEYNFGDIDGGLEDDGVSQTLGGRTATISDAGRVFGRVGYVYGEYLPYALLGYSSAKLEISGNDGGSGDIDGVTAGIGVERRFMGKLSGYAEYSYTDYGDVAGADDQLSVDVNEVKLGVNYRF